MKLHACKEVLYVSLILVKVKCMVGFLSIDVHKMVPIGYVLNDVLIVMEPIVRIVIMHIIMGLAKIA